MLLAALRSGRYYADASWTIAPYGNGRLCRYRAAAAYKLYTDPHNFSRADMLLLFFQPKTREENHEWAEAMRKEHRRFLGHARRSVVPRQNILESGLTTS